jgi:transcriptional regulator with XRE-family HTH domain
MCMGTSADQDAARRAELAAYLRARRESLQPANVGLHPPPTRRNTPGLRREEVAQVSGVGITWYTWLEQGRPITTTPSVIDALARALRFDREGHAHLRRLAGLPLPESDQLPDDPDDGLRRLLDVMLPAPACIMGPRFDMVAWNEPFARIWHPEALPPERCNVLWMAFCEPGWRKTWTNWEERARTLLAEFRAAAGQHAGDPRFAELITDLHESSVEFRSWWRSYEVRQSITGRLKARIPGTGTIHMDVLDLQVCSHPSLRLSVQTPVRPSDYKRLVDLMAPSPRTVVSALNGDGPSRRPKATSSRPDRSGRRRSLICA